jgi:hypothetical protein
MPEFLFHLIVAATVIAAGLALRKWCNKPSNKIITAESEQRLNQIRKDIAGCRTTHMLERVQQEAQTFLDYYTTRIDTVRLSGYVNILNRDIRIKSSELQGQSVYG